MKKFIHAVKKDLSLIGILPGDASLKPKKFTLLKLNVDSRSQRSLYEKFTDEPLLDILNKTHVEIMSKFRSINKQNKLGSPTTTMLSRRKSDVTNASPEFKNLSIKNSLTKMKGEAAKIEKGAKR